MFCGVVGDPSECQPSLPRPAAPHIHEDLAIEPEKPTGESEPHTAAAVRMQERHPIGCLFELKPVKAKKRIPTLGVSDTE